MVGELVTDDPGRAVSVLRAGRLAVLPTETVYGLGALASDVPAVARVFALKGRPADHPLIVHLPGVDAVAGWAVDVPAYAWRLAEQCWPGSLTLVLPRGPRAGHHVTGGQETVGLRVPDHPLTLEVLGRLDDGVAAPSANRFGHVSPTTADHALHEIGDELVPGADVVLDGGPCRVGVESTIVDCTGNRPRLLRPGAVDTARLVDVGQVDLDGRASTVRAPGTLRSHYAPRARVVLAGGDEPTANLEGPGGDEPTADLDQAGRARPRTGLLALASVPTPSGVVRLSAPADDAEYASVLYAALREADVLGLRTVLAVPPEDGPLAPAVLDRLSRAAAGR